MSVLDTSNPQRSRGGYTLIEVVITSAISVLIGAAVLTLFVWCASTASLCSKMSWSQHEAM